MIFEMTVQFRVSDIKEGQKWYETLLNKKVDYAPHEGFLEWELFPGCWLQIAEGKVNNGNGPLRLGVTNIEDVRSRLIKELNVNYFEIDSRPEVPARWGTFNDPWGNQLGLFEYIDKDEEKERIKTILGTYLENIK